MSKDQETVAVQVASADVKLWLWEPFPVILVLYDAMKDRAFWQYVQSYAANQGISDDATESVTIRVPTTNRFDRAAIQKIREFRDAILAQVKGVIGHGR